MKNIYSIYKLIDPITNDVRYIGVTTNSLKNRLYQHKYNSKKLKTHSAKWINSLLKKDFSPIIELIEICDENNWEEKEKYWISYYDNLTNHHIGGKGVILNRTKESINSTSNSKKISLIQINKQGEFIKEWDSIKEASDFLGKSPNAITMSIKNNNYCGGFKWVKKCNYNKKNNYINNKKHYRLKKVYVYNMYGIFEKEFNSLKETVLFFETTKENIMSCIKNFSRYKNYFFSYTYYDIYENKKKYNIIQQYSLDNILIKEFNSFKEVDSFFNLKGFFSSIYHKKEKSNKEIIWRNYKWKIMKI